jgi:hypothetical protein
MNQHFSLIFEELLQTLYFKMRHYTSCLVSDIKWDVQLPEGSEVQVRFSVYV